MGGEFFTDFKSLNGIEYLDKLKCYRILSDSVGPPPWGWQMGGWGWGWAWMYGGGVPCMHACTRMHTHACMYAHAC